MASKIHPYSKDLYLIELIPPLPGFDTFIGVWLHRGNPAYIVDVGPAVSAGFLLQALNKLRITRLDYILLTHIHLDHAGGIGEIAVHFPETPIVVHEKGLTHLADPTRLWKGSVKTLGDKAKGYGPISPVPEGRLIGVKDFVMNGIVSVITPGHSPHHVSYLTADGYLFAGEAGGVCFELPDGRTWMRPATPPRFFLADALSSIDALLGETPDTICYGHFGIQTGAVRLLARQRAQLLLWEKVVGEEIRRYSSKDIVKKCLEQLLRQDPELAGYKGLMPDQQKRETYFLINSIKGYLSYFEALADEP